MADISFDDVKSALKLPDGREWDDTKLKEAIEAAIKEGGELSQIVDRIKVEDLSIEKKDSSANVDNKENQGTTISDHDNPGNENTHEPKESEGAETPVDDNWNEDYKNEWRQWATDNDKEFEDINIAGSENDVCIRLYDSKDKKNNGEYAAQISYKSPHNVTLKGYNGNTPDNKYFEQTVALAMKKNGPDIEFGDIKSPEFKAKLLAACYINGANPVNGPTEEEMSQWPKELQDMVNDAKTKASEGAENQEKTAEADKAPKTEEKEPVSYANAWSDTLDHKMDKPGEEFDLGAYTDIKDKATYFAAAQMAGIKVKNAPTAEELNGITDPQIQAVLNDAKELNAVREKINDHKTNSPDEVMDVTMFNKNMQTYYNIAALESGVKLSTTLEEDDLKKQPRHLESALRRQRNEAKVAEIRKKKASEKGIDEKTFEQNRNAERKIRIDAFKAQRDTGR